MRRRWTIGVVLLAALSAVALGTCVTDQVQRRPPEPGPDTPPTLVGAPPFAADTSQEQVPTQGLSSRPIVQGEVIQVDETSLTVRDELGHAHQLALTPETRQVGPIEEGAQVRAAWALDEGTLVATEVTPALPPGAEGESP